MHCFYINLSEFQWCWCVDCLTGDLGMDITVVYSWGPTEVTALGEGETMVTTRMRNTRLT